MQGLTEKWENFRLAAIIAGAIAGAIAAVVIGFAEYKIRYDIPARLKVSKAQQLAELAKKEAYHWPVWFIEEQPNWDEVKLDSSEGRRLFVEQEDALPGAAVTTQFVLKHGDHSELWGEKHVLGAQYRWLSGQYSGSTPEPVQFGDSQLSVRAAVQGTNLGRVIRGADENDKIDVIGVGLESFPSNEDDPKRKLSRLRGRDLAVAAKHSIDSIDPDKEPSYRSLGMGRAKVEVTDGTPAEQLQRRLVIIVSARKDTLPKDEAIKIIMNDVSHPSIDLSIYEFSNCPEQLLSAPVNFEGGGSTAWLDSGPTIEDVCD